MNIHKASDLIEWRLTTGANKLWCYNTCVVWDIEIGHAALYGYIEIVKLMLEGPVKISQHTRNWALRAASEEGYPEVVKIMLKAGGNPHAMDMAAIIGAEDPEVFKLLEDWIADHEN